MRDGDEQEKIDLAVDTNKTSILMATSCNEAVHDWEKDAQVTGNHCVGDDRTA